MTALYLTMRERNAKLEQENAYLRALYGLKPDSPLSEAPENHWRDLQTSITCIAIERQPPEVEAAIRAWGEVLHRIMSEHVLFQYAAGWLVHEGYRVTRFSSESDALDGEIHPDGRPK